jgi:uncharacterized protein (TIGR03000 family)
LPAGLNKKQYHLSVGSPSLLIRFEENRSMCRTLLPGLGIVLGLLGGSPSLAVGADAPPRGSFFETPPQTHSTEPILFRNHYPTTPPPAAQSYQSFFEDRSDPVSSVHPGRVPSSALPWNRPGFKPHDEPPTAAPTRELDLPEKYRLRKTLVSRAVPNASRNAAVIVAHLPKESPLWVEGRRTAATGTVRSFQSPPLPAGKKFLYTVRAVWFENGKWVGQSLEVSVRAGDMTALYLERLPAPIERTAKAP